MGGGGGTNSWGGPFGGGGGNAGAGAGMGGFGGGNGDSVGNGGGGGAYGPAIFVAGGGLTTINSGASNSTATGGAPGTSRGSSSATAGGADATPVFSYGGTINGAVGLNGPIAGALSGSAPALRRGRGSRFHAKQAPRKCRSEAVTAGSERRCIVLSPACDHLQELGFSRRRLQK